MSTPDRFVVVKTNGGQGEYVCTADGAGCFLILLKALGYTVEIEELDDENSSKDGSF